MVWWGIVNFKIRGIPKDGSNFHLYIYFLKPFFLYLIAYKFVSTNILNIRKMGFNVGVLCCTKNMILKFLERNLFIPELFCKFLLFGTDYNQR